MAYRAAPPSPLQSSEIRLLLAWVDANLHTADPIRAMAQFESAVLREMDRQSGQLGIDRMVRELVPTHLKPLFALPSPEGLHAIIGGYESVTVEGDTFQSWKPGLAKVAERESEAFQKSLHLIWDEEIEEWRTRTSIEIGRAMKASQRTGMALPPDTVDVMLARARAKVRALFGLSAS